MQTENIILITTLCNLVLHPILNYLLHSRCTHIEMCCVKCDRTLHKDDKDKDEENQL